MKNKSWSKVREIANIKAMKDYEKQAQEIDKDANIKEQIIEEEMKRSEGLEALVREVFPFFYKHIREKMISGS